MKDRGAAGHGHLDSTVREGARVGLGAEMGQRLKEKKDFPTPSESLWHFSSADDTWSTPLRTGQGVSTCIHSHANVLFYHIPLTPKFSGEVLCTSAVCINVGSVLVGVFLFAFGLVRRFFPHYPHNCCVWQRILWLRTDIESVWGLVFESVEWTGLYKIHNRQQWEASKNNPNPAFTELCRPLGSEKKTSST